MQKKMGLTLPENKVSEIHMARYMITRLIQNYGKKRHQHQLVGGLNPLKNMTSSIGMIIATQAIWENLKSWQPVTTNQSTILVTFGTGDHGTINPGCGVGENFHRRDWSSLNEYP